MSGTFKRISKIVIPSLLVAGGLVLVAELSFAKAEYTKKEKKACTVCHLATGKKELNDTGKCYEEHHHSMEGCQAKK